MAINRYDPYQEMLSLRNAMEQLFAQSFVNPNWMGGSQSMTAMPPMNVVETENGYEVDVLLPGVKPEDVEVTVEQNTLTIKGKYSHRSEEEGKSRDWLRQEISSGSFQRSITFPKPIDPNNIRATFENGVLTLKVPINETSRARRIEIGRGQTQPQQVTVGAGKQ